MYMVILPQHLVLQHLVSDDDERSSESTPKEDNEPREQGVPVVDVNRQCLQEHYNNKHFIIVQLLNTLSLLSIMNHYYKAFKGPFK